MLSYFVLCEIHVDQSSLFVIVSKLLEEFIEEGMLGYGRQSLTIFSSKLGKIICKFYTAC